jgi:hypothetical protein
MHKEYGLLLFFNVLISQHVVGMNNGEWSVIVVRSPLVNKIGASYFSFFLLLRTMYVKYLITL